MTKAYNTPNDPLLRISSVIAPGGPLPISRSSFYQGIREGRYPAPLKLGPRTSVWRQSDIDKLVESLAQVDRYGSPFEAEEPAGKEDE